MDLLGMSSDAILERLRDLMLEQQGEEWSDLLAELDTRLTEGLGSLPDEWEGALHAAD